MSASPLVIVVDDDRQDRELLLSAIRSSANQLDVTCVSSGTEALDLLEREERPIALLMLDLKMPKLDGLEVLRIVRSRRKTKTLPVVVFTTSAHDEDLAEAYALGANAFVVKPMRFEELADVVTRIVVFWTAVNATPQST